MKFTAPSAFARSLAALALAALTVGAHAQKKYDVGVTDTEIKLGNIMPYSGPGSAYSAVGKAMSAYFDKVNAEEGGVNGRKIVFISVDDGFNPAKTVEQTRKLVEQEKVLLMLGTMGTAPNVAIQKYLNSRKVPQLFLQSGAARWADPKNFPWTIGWQPNYQTEGRIYAKHILATNPNARIAVLQQNDDMGKDYLKGFTEGLGDKAKSMIVAQASFEVTDPTIDSQMVTLKASGADTIFYVTTSKFGAQAIRKAAEMGWKPTGYVNSISMSVSAVLKPAGLENSKGLISATFMRDPTDPRWADTKEFKDFIAWMKKYFPGADPADSSNVIGYTCAQMTVQTLKQAGDNLTRENIMKEAANLNMKPPMLYPGVSITTGPNDFQGIKQVQLIQFNGTTYEPIGNVVGG